MAFYNTPKRNLVRDMALCFVLCLGVLFNSATAWASTSSWVDTDFSRVRVVSGQETLGEQGLVMLGLQFELEEGSVSYTHLTLPTKRIV